MKPMIAMLMLLWPLATQAGDAAKGENEFKKCASCHAITAADGSELRKGGKTGPNLFGVVGRPVASAPDYPYGGSILAVGAAGAVWDEAMLAEYVANPTLWLQTRLSDKGATSNMSFKLAKGGADVAAYLATFGTATP